MLRTNSKLAKLNLRRYILDNFDPCNYCTVETWEKMVDGYNGDGFDLAAAYILRIFESEKWFGLEKYFRHNHRAAFVDWCQGLPSVLDCRHYYNSAVEIVADILEETPEESNRFTECEAENFLTNYIYDALTRAANPARNYVATFCK